MRVVSSQCVLVVQPLASPIILASVAGGLVCLVSVSWTGRVGFSTLPVLLDQHFGTKTISTTHGLTLSAWAFAGLSGNQLAAFVVAHAPDQVHRHAALIPVLAGLFTVGLVSISLVAHFGKRGARG